jgi:tetratricopeptide (TPR) repeat protein
MGVFGWTVIGSAAGLVSAAIALFGLIPRLRARRPALGPPSHHDGDGRRAAEPSKALLPAPVLDVEVRGREQVVEELAAFALAPSGHVQVLCGLGGLGKSTVARAVAARIVAKDRRVWWVPAGDAVSVTQLLLGLAKELGASRGQVEEALAGRLNPSDVLWQQLEDAHRWTLVLDNADDPGVLAAGDRQASSGSAWLRSTRSGLVLVTSRVSDRQAWGSVAQVHRLEPLDEAEGAQVLLDLAPRAGDHAAARSLSAELGGLPLALHQAGSYLASPFATAATFGLYQQALSVRFAELMGRGTEDRERVIATWELSLDALAAHGIGQARTLLRVLSCFASAVPVPPLLLNSHVLAELCGSVTKMEDGLSGLLSVGLIDTLFNSEAGPPSVKVHPLVAQTIRYRAAAALPELLGVAVKLLDAAADKLNHDDPQYAADWVALVPHLRALQLLDVRLPAEAEASLAKTAARLTLALVWGGSYVAALELTESGLKRRHGLSEDHEMVLQLRMRRASARQFLGQYSEAEHEYRQVLAAEQRVLGANHPETLTTRHHLATVLTAEGKPAEALAEFRQVLADRQHVLGADHPSTLSTLHEIGRALGAQDKPAAAAAEYRQVLADRQHVLGADHPSTLATRHDIAQMMARQGKPAEAEAEYRQVLAIQQRVLGADHPDTLTTRHDIAHALGEQGKTAEAMAEFRHVLDARQRVLGADHPSTLITRHEIAYLLADQGKTAEAETEFRQVLTIQQRVLGADHPDTLTTRHDIARMMGEQDKSAEALAEFRHVLDARQGVLGADHSFTLATRHEIAHVLAVQGKIAEALAEFRKVRDAEVRTLGADHPSTLTTRTNLASMLAARGKTAEALADLRRVLATQQRMLAADHPSMLITRQVIATVLAAQGKTAEAETEFRQLLAIQQRVLGADHPDTRNTAASLHWLKDLRRGSHRPPRR